MAERMERGYFITFEGIEGCGKSTQLRLIADRLAARGIPVFCTREPGGTKIGDQIRRILLSEESTALSPLSEALLYLAERFQHVTEVLRPELESKQIVLCDRYHDSTLAYQGYARKIPTDLLEKIWRQSGIALEPDLTLLFDVEPGVGIRRSLEKLRKRKLDESRFEKETLEFHEQVRQGFLALARANSQRIVVLDGNGTIEDVHRKTVEVLKGWLEPRIGHEVF